MQYLGYILFRGVVFLVGLLPFSAMYRLSDGLAWFFYKILGYRKKVVFSNLRRCFPEKSDQEIERIARLSYVNLTDIILEGIKSMTMSLEEVHARYQYLGVEKVQAHLDAGKSIVVCGSHYCNWEWGVITAADNFPQMTFGVYKPLKNTKINDFFNKSRTKGRMNLLAMRETHSRMEAEKNNPAVYFLIADQSPSNRKTAQWVSFFGQETACLPGPDFLSRKYGHPVFHFEANRISRGYYTLEFTEVCLNPTELPETGVTKAYMDILETAIRRQPENWLWSHKRWKMGKA